MPPRTVLIVDDDPYVVGLLSALLLRFDFHILTAQSPSQALRIAENRTNPLDLMITDIHMPEMNGVELAKKIRQRRPMVKVIYMSGDTEAEALVLVADQSSPFLGKPFGLEELEGTVRPVLAEIASRETGKECHMCPKCNSKNVRRSQRRIYDWLLLPLATPYRCRDCRNRLLRVRVIGKMMRGW
jgi:DNA-binding response OmpR family regulator